MALWDKRQKRAKDIMDVRNEQYLHSMNPYTKPDDTFDPDMLEEGDMAAMIISALLVFLPVFLLMGLVVYLAFRFLR